MRQLSQFYGQSNFLVGQYKNAVSQPNSLQASRLKCIIIEDSRKHLVGKNFRESDVVTARNPWTLDPNFDYDMDSEDELEEE